MRIAAAGGPPGNRLWRLETPAGPLLQKWYGPKAGPLRDGWRSFFSRVIRGATGTSPAERRATERATLALWREAGVDVPRDRTAEFPALAAGGGLLLEWIDGPPLDRALRAAPDRAAREALLRRWGAALGARHVLAAARDDARFVQFHAGPMHLLVAGERLVAIDLEQVYLPGRAVLPRAARELAACLRGLFRTPAPVDLRADLADLAAFAAGHPDRDLLRRTVASALRGGAVALLDPGRARKEGPLRLLAGILGPG
jgi:hypothetical protein